MDISPQIIPPCPNCNERQWQVNGDVTNRAAVFVDASPRVCIDRCGPDGSRLSVGNVACAPCGWDAPVDSHEFEAVAFLATGVIQRTDDDRGEWSIIHDYREF